MTPQKLIKHLIFLEERKRRGYLTTNKFIRKDFSDGAISQMTLILKKKRLGIYEHRILSREIDNFQKSIR